MILDVKSLLKMIPINTATNFLVREFISLDDNFKVLFKIESYESIHPYNVYAELSTTIGELKRKIKSKSNN